MRYLLAVTAPNARQAKTLAVMAENAGLELITFGAPHEAAAWLERNDPRAVVLDLRVAGVNDVCRKVRSKRQLCGVPIIALTRQIADGEAARFYAVGVDEVLPLDANAQLLARLRQLSQHSLAPPQHQGIAIVADPEAHRGDIFGRVFMNAGYDIKYAVDERSLILAEAASKAKVIVVSAKLGDPRTLIETARADGSSAVWVVVVPRRELEALDQRLTGLEGVAVIARDAPPTDSLFFANELRLPAGARQRKGERRLYGTQVRFRGVGGVDTDFGFSYNVSDAGMYVRTLAPPVADRVWLEVRPPHSSEWACLEAEVAWRRPFSTESGAAVPPGFGVKLLSGLGQSLVAWKRAMRDFSRSTPHRAGGGLATLVSETLVSEGVPSVVEDSVVEAAPAWGAEEEEATTLDGLVTPKESWEPVMDEDQLLASVRPPPAAALPPDLPLPPPPRRPPPERLPNGPASPRALPPLPAVAVTPDATTDVSVLASMPESPRVVMVVPLGAKPKRSVWALGAIGAGGLLLAGSVWALAGGDAAAEAAPVVKPSPVSRPAAAPPAPATPAAADVAKAELPSPTPANAKAPPTLTKAAVPTDDSDLKANEGGLLVHSQAGLRVFVQGVERGRTNERFVLPCGYRFVRLQGTADGVWVSEGVSVLVTCKTTTEVELAAQPAG